MHSHTDATVFIVDDDASVREGMAWLLRTRRLLSEAYDSADAFLQMLNTASPAWGASGLPLQAGCILLDVRMPGMSGLALLSNCWTVVWRKPGP